MNFPNDLYLPCLIEYSGIGRLKLQRNLNGYEGAHLSTFILNENTMRYEAEWFPGFTGLSFNALKLYQFQKDSDERFNNSSIIFQHPEWTCDDYEKFLKN